MQRFGRFVNPYFSRFTLRHAVLRAPFCGEANYSKAASSLQGSITQSV
jgi:hypothetical protein